jgi:hypothetical protein
VKLPIDTKDMTFLAAGPPEPVLDFETKAAKLDEHGQSLFTLQTVAMADGAAEVISVKVPGEPKGITQGTAIKVSGLVATPWTMGDRNGVAYRATQIEALAASRSAS